MSFSEAMAKHYKDLQVHDSGLNKEYPYEGQLGNRYILSKVPLDSDALNEVSRDTSYEKDFFIESAIRTQSELDKLNYKISNADTLADLLNVLNSLDDKEHIILKDSERLELFTAHLFNSAGTYIGTELSLQGGNHND